MIAMSSSDEHRSRQPCPSLSLVDSPDRGLISPLVQELKPSWTELWVGMLEALGLRSPEPELEYVTDDRIDKLLRDAPDLLCPIYHILMTRPATLYGQVYEYDAIHKWVLENGRDPYDRPAATSQIEPMPSMRALIQEFADENNVPLGQSWCAHHIRHLSFTVA